MQSLIYVISAPYFYLGIGMTIATSIFIGASLFNGDLEKLRKGLLTVGGYAFFLIAITYTRVFAQAAQPGSNHTLAYAGLWTWLIITTCYFSGLILGVTIVKITRRNTPSTKEMQKQYKREESRES